MSRLPWDGPLFLVKGHLADRYNQALEHCVKLSSPLTEFTIDRMGWSPQLAATLGEDYLGGDALRYAIILSPDQVSAPPVRRRFSYEAEVIEQVYLDARATLLSLVEYEPVVVEMDNGLVFCRTAGDILGINSVTPRIDTPRATLVQSRTLLELGTGLSEKARLLDEQYIEQMLALATQVGDPRKRVLPPALQIQVHSLWGEVAGTTYILRPPAGAATNILLIATRIGRLAAGAGVTALEIDDPHVVNVLLQQGYIHYANVRMLLPKRLAELETEALLAIGEAAPARDGTARRRQLASNPSVRSALPSLYWELDALQKQLGSSANGGIDPARLSVEARWALATPACEAEVVGHLIARFVRFSHPMMALHHRRILGAEWARYSEAKRRYLSTTFPYMVQGFIPPSNASS